MNVLYLVLLTLSLSWIVSEIFERLRLPRILAPIFVGLSLSFEPIKSYILNAESEILMHSLAEIGLVFLMFYVGFEINIAGIMKTGRQATSVALTSAVVAFALGFITGKFLGFDSLTSLVLGAALSVTAEAVAVNILEELGMLHSKIGNVVVAAGLIDDLIEVLFLGIIISLTNPTQGSSPFLSILYVVLFGLFVVFIYRYVLPRMILLAEKNNLETNLFMISVIIALVFAILTKFIGLGEILGALIAGGLMNRAIEKHRRAELKQKKKQLFSLSTKQFKNLKLHMREHNITTNAIKTTAFGLLVPFFYIWVGINVNVFSILEQPALTLTITIVAFIAKIGGCILGNKLGHSSAKEGYIIGWAMNSRGSVELVFAEIARAAGLINNELFSALVFMTIFTTLMSPVMFKYLITQRKTEKIRRRLAA